MKRIRRSWSVIVGALFIMSLPACLILRPSREGQVLYSVTRVPAPGIKLRRVISYNSTLIPVDGAQHTYAYDTEALTNVEGRYAFPFVATLKLPWGRSVNEQIEVQVPSGHFSRILDEEHWSPTILLVPQVKDMAECRGDSECEKENEALARWCYYEHADRVHRMPGCSIYEEIGYFKFIDNSNDYTLCNGMTDADAVDCIDDASMRKGISNKNSCSRLENESQRQYCYLMGASSDWCLGRKGEGCENLSDSKISAEWKKVATRKLQLFDVSDQNFDTFRSICTRYTSKNFGNKCWR